MRVLKIVVVLAVLASVSAGPDLAQTGEDIEALRAEVDALKAGQESIRKELNEIKDLLRAMGAKRREVGHPNLALDVSDDPYKGDKNAKLTLIEFSDYQCPFCARFSRQTLPQLEKEYIEAGKVKFVFRDFPMGRMHKQAFKAAEAANCANDQGRYWEMHDRIFADQKALGPENISNHAQALGLDMTKFQQCLESGKYATEIRKDMAEGYRVGVNGTPTFFLGVTEPDKPTVRPLIMIRGAVPYAKFKEAIDSLLSAQNE